MSEKPKRGNNTELRQRIPSIEEGASLHALAFQMGRTVENLREALQRECGPAVTFSRGKNPIISIDPIAYQQFRQEKQGVSSAKSRSMSEAPIPTRKLRLRCSLSNLGNDYIYFFHNKPPLDRMSDHNSWGNIQDIARQPNTLRQSQD